MMFDPVRICELLNEEGVDYVIVGGFASVVHRSSLPTQDIGVVPSRRLENLDCLGRALRRMNAMIRTGGEPVSAPIDARFLANMPIMLNLVTDLGDVDLTFTPSGGLGGFEQRSVHALSVEIAEGLTVRIAALDAFLFGTNTMVGVTSTGDTPCYATNTAYRLDTTDARDFLKDFVTLP